MHLLQRGFPLLSALLIWLCVLLQTPSRGSVRGLGRSQLQLWITSCCPLHERSEGTAARARLRGGQEHPQTAQWAVAGARERELPK